MFPETDDMSTIISDTVKVLFKRRLVDRVLRAWMELADKGRIPSREQIQSSKLGVDWANCLLIAVRSPAQLSQFVAVGDNLSVEHSPKNTLPGVLLSHLSVVLSERRCLMIEGRAMLRNVDALYRSALYPLSEDGFVIDHLLGAVSYRPNRENEDQAKPLVRTKWLS